VNPPPTPAEQLARTAAQLGLTLDELRSGGRPFADARALAAWALRKTFAGLRLAQIGELLGYRDHTTVCYHLRRVARKAQADPAYAAQAQALIPGRYRVHTQRVVVVVVSEQEEGVYS